MPHHAARLAELITADFYGQGLVLSERNAPPDAGTWAGMPEVKAVKRLRESGISERGLRLFITFVAAMDRIRDADVLWGNGVRFFQEHPEMFEPAEIVATPLLSLRMQLMSFGVSKLHVPDSEAWSVIARSLVRDDSPVTRVVELGAGDARDLLRDLRKRMKGRSRFPLLRGDKIGPMWVRMLAAPGGATIEHINAIPVQVDVQVRRATRDLGVADPPGGEIDGHVRSVIQSAWRDAVDMAKFGGPPGIAGTCAALDPALWALGKYGSDHYKKLAEP